ncbi:MAG: hypothetical protein H0V36_02395 [Chloroflexi bacterium]|nr:hypothetical protein [Chloroflexota bacterium]
MPSAEPTATAAAAATQPVPTSTYRTGVSAGTIDVTTFPTSEAPISGRDGASGVWTGDEVIIWGGEAPDGARGDGAAYDPVRDTWRPIADGPLTPRGWQESTWTGSEMLIWGRTHRGRDAPAGERWLSDGAAYDPATDRWRRIADAPLAGRQQFASVWTGTEWLIAEFPGLDGPPTTYVATYDPVSDTWRSLPSLDGVEWLGMAAWAGDRPILAVGSDAGEIFYGHVPGDAGWVESTSPDGLLVSAPVGWTGDQLIVICRQDQWFFLCALDPTSRTWEVLAQPPSYAGGSRPVWTGEHFLFPQRGLSYDSTTGSWFTFDPPEGIDLSEEVAVWAGDRLVVWGGNGGDGSPRRPDGIVVVPEW